MPLRPPNLVDLSTFGIHFHNTGTKCCNCGKPTGKKKEAARLDEVCYACMGMTVPGPQGKPAYAMRYEHVFCRPESVWVMPPNTRQSNLRIVWGDTLTVQGSITYYLGVVRIDGYLFTTRGGHLYHGGELVKDYALHLEDYHIQKIYAAQQRSV